MRNKITFLATFSFFIAATQSGLKNAAHPIFTIKNRLSFRYLFVSIIFMLLSVNVAWGQTTIASEGLNNSSTLFTLGGTGGDYYSGNSTASDGPATSPFAVEGTYSRGVSNNNTTLTSSNINTSAYTSVYLSFRLASFSIGSATNGADGTDIVTVEVSPNGGTNYYSTVRVLGNSNAYWAYSATGIASTAYDGNATPVDFTPAGGGVRTTDGYSTVTITGLPQASNMRVRITLLNNATAERWVVDDFKVLGTASGCTAPTINTQPSNATVNEGTTASYSVSASGTITSYQWQVSTNGGTSWSNVSDGTGGTTSAYTTIATTSSMNSYQYRVIVYNGACNTTSNTATLTVRSFSYTPTTLTFSSINVGTTSASQPVTVTGTNLSVAPTYDISGTDAAMFSTSGSLTTSGGTVNVTFSPTSLGSKSATLNIRGESGVIVKTVNISGTGTLATPTASAATSVGTTSFTANWGVVSVASCYNLNVYTKTGGTSTLLTEDFASIVTGDNTTTSGSGTSWTGNTNFPTVSAAYQAGGAVKIGTNSGVGSITSKSLTLSSTSDVTVNFDVKGWTTVEGDLSVTFASTTNTVTYTTVMAGSFESKSTTFTNVAAGSYTVTIATTAKRAFIDNVIVTTNSLVSTPISGSPFTGIATNSYSVTGLTSSTTYYYSVIATDCGSTTSGTSNEISVTTLTGPTITVSTTAISSLDYSIGSGPSVAQTFIVSGSSLTDNIIITSPANFELSKDGGITYDEVITLTQSGGTVNATTIYARLIEEMPQGLYSGNISLASTGAGTKTVSLSGEVELNAPTATSATSVTASSFQANWNTVAGATGYKVYVYTKSGGTVSFSEDFSGFTSGTVSSPTSTDISSSLNSYTQMNGWTGSNVFQAGGIAKLGSGSKQGKITTPSLDLSGSNIEVEFKAMGWDGDATTMSVLLDGVSIATPAIVANQSTWTTITLPITGGTSSSKITFQGKQASNSRLFIDDVAISTGAGTAEVQISGSPFVVNDGATNMLTVYGLSANTQYYYRVTALYNMAESVKSNEIAVSTIAPTSTPVLSVTEPTVPVMNAFLGTAVTETIHVSGANLTDNVVFSISGTNASYFTAVPAFITKPSNGTLTSTAITITYLASVTGTHTATLTITSAGANDITLSLTGKTTVDNNITIGDINADGSLDMNFNSGGDLHVYESENLKVATGIFFSKYLEAEGNNKLLEIFNGTTADVELTGWKIQVRQIGSTGGNHTWNDGTVYDYPLSGTLQKGKTLVFYTKDASTSCSSSFNQSWINCNTTVLQFNGNDPIRLVNSAGTVVDLFGQTSGNFPTTDGANTKGWWTTGLTENFNTMRKLLLRKISVTSGENSVAQNITAFNTLSTEWELFPTDYSVDAISCEVLQQFGDFDYNANYSEWTASTHTTVTNGNKITFTPSLDAIPNCSLIKVTTEKSDGTVTATDFIRKPIYVTGANTHLNDITGVLTDEVCAECDIAVLSAGALAASATNKKYKNVYVLSGGKLDISDGNWEINNLTMKAGYTGNLFNSFPSASMKLTNTLTVKGRFTYARTIDDSQWYFISLPYDVTIDDLSAFNPLLGKYDTDWFIKYWDGAARANNRTASGNWIRYVPGNSLYETTGGTLKANRGYIIGLGRGIKEVVFPLFYDDVLVSEVAKTIPVTAFKKSDGTSDPYSDGWNLIGLPYLSRFNGDGSNLPFFYLSDGGSSKTYTYFSPSDLQADNALNPFISYYVQAGTALESTGVTFALSSRLLAPSAYSDSSDDVRVYYKSATGEDYMNLRLNETQNAAYEVGSDLVKWVGTGTPKPQIYMNQGGYNLAINAVNYSSAVNIPVSVYNQSSGSATFRAEAMNAAGLSSLELTDNANGSVTDLLSSDYTYVASSGTVNNRFYLTARRVATGSSTTIASNGVRMTSAGGTLRIENIPAGSSVYVCDASGRAFLNETRLAANHVELNNLSKGIYLVRVTTEGKTSNSKIIF